LLLALQAILFEVEYGIILKVPIIQDRINRDFVICEMDKKRKRTVLLIQQK